MEKGPTKESSKQKLLELKVEEGATYIKNKLSPAVLKIDKDMKMSSQAGKKIIIRLAIFKGEFSRR